MNRNRPLSTITGRARVEVAERISVMVDDEDFVTRITKEANKRTTSPTTYARVDVETILRALARELKMDPR